MQGPAVRRCLGHKRQEPIVGSLDSASSRLRRHRGGPMTGLTTKNIDSPDEVREMKDGKGRIDLVDLGSGLMGRATFESGWKWSEHVKPMAGTDSCQAAHVGYCISG